MLELGERFDGVRPAALRIAGRAPSRRWPRSTPSSLPRCAPPPPTSSAVAEARSPASAGRRSSPGRASRSRISEIAVGAAGIYVPGGRAPYPSTVLMGVIPARVAGVERVVVASPVSAEPADASRTRRSLAACAIAGVDEVYAIGGAQAIAALASEPRSSRRST